MAFFYSAGSTTTPTDFGSYTIYTASDGSVKAKNNITGGIVYSTASAPATSTQTTSLFNSVFTALNSTGGLVFVKNGVYLMDGLTSTINIGNASFPRAFIKFIGESLQGTVLKATGTAWPSQAILSPQSDCFIQNMTLDGNNGTAHYEIACGQPIYLDVDRVRLLGANGINLWTGIGILGQRFTNLWFDTNGSLTADTLATGGNPNYTIVDNCYFDTGFYGPSSGGGANSANLSFTNNIVKMPTTASGRNDGGYAMSLEVDQSTGYNNVLIANNKIINGSIALGLNTTWPVGAVMTNVNVVNNVIDGAGIRVLGPPTGSYTGKINGFNISNNILSNCGLFGIDVEHADGPVTIHNNQIRDTNKSYQVGNIGFCGPIYLDTCNYINVESNTIWMTDTTTNANPFAIKTIGTGMTNLRLVDNYIRNATGNTALVLNGTYSTTINRGNDIV
jgi:hypothetical protein